MTPAVWIWNIIEFIGVKIIWYPLYFIGHSVFWQFVCVSLIGGFLNSFKNAFFESGGIFAEYFSASYNDYCPGIRWVDDEGNEIVNED